MWREKPVTLPVHHNSSMGIAKGTWEYQVPDVLTYKKHTAKIGTTK